MTIQLILQLQTYRADALSLAAIDADAEVAPTFSVNWGDGLSTDVRARYGHSPGHPNTTGVAVHNFPGDGDYTVSVHDNMSEGEATANLILRGLSKADLTLSGGKGQDAIAAGSGDDRITAGAGNDDVLGGRGADSIKGGSGGDRLEGGDGDDVLAGGAGADTLVGNGGADVITGGADRDIFQFGDPGGSGGLGSTADRITDFQPGVDLIDLHLLAYYDDTVLEFIGEHHFKVRSDGHTQVRFEQHQDTTVIYLDDHGDGRNEIAIKLDGLVDLTRHDFDFAA